MICYNVYGYLMLINLTCSFAKKTCVPRPEKPAQYQLTLDTIFSLCLHVYKYNNKY